MKSRTPSTRLQQATYTQLIKIEMFVRKGTETHLMSIKKAVKGSSRTYSIIGTLGLLTKVNGFYVWKKGVPITRMLALKVAIEMVRLQDNYKRPTIFPYSVVIEPEIVVSDPIEKVNVVEDVALTPTSPEIETDISHETTCKEEFFQPAIAEVVTNCKFRFVLLWDLFKIETFYNNK